MSGPPFAAQSELSLPRCSVSVSVCSHNVFLSSLIQKTNFQSRKRLYNHQCPSVCPSVSYQNPMIAYNHSFHLTTTFATTHTITHNILHTVTHNITTQHHKTTSQHNISMQHHNATLQHNIIHNITPQHHTLSRTPSQPSSSSSSITSFT